MSTKCVYLKLRTSLKNLSLNSTLTVLKDVPSYAYVVEGSLTDNPHVHFYLELDPLSLKLPALRARLRTLGLKGNGGYSLKTLDERCPIEYLAYMLKEGDVTWFNIPQDIIDEAKAYDLKVKAEMKEKKELKKANPVWKQIMETLGPEPKWPQIIDAVFDYHLEKKLLIREFQLLSLCQTIAFHGSPEYRKMLKNKIKEKML